MESSPKFQKHLFFIPLVLTLGYAIIGAYSKPLHDFSNAYFSAYFLLEGSFNTNIWDALKFNQQVKDAGFSEMFVAYYPNTPFLAFFFSPFTFIKEPLVAKFLFNSISAILFLRAIFRLDKALNINPWVLCVLPVIFFTSICNNIYFGQVYLLLFFLIIEGMLAFEHQEKIRHGGYWALAILLKVFPVLLILPLLLRDSFRAVGAIAIFSFGWIVLSLTFLDLSDWWYYLSEVFPKSNNGEYYDGFTPKAKSVTMLFKNLFVQDEVLNPSPFYTSHIAYLLVQALYKATVVATLIFFSKWHQNAWKEQIAFWAIGTMLLSPGWSSYASIMLLLPCLIVVTNQMLLWKQKIGFVVLIAFYCNLPMAYFWELPLLLKFPKVYLLLSIFFYYNYLLNRATSRTLPLDLRTKLLILGGLFLVFGSMGFMGAKMEKNHYVLEKEEEILIADYKIKQGYLEYNYWTLPKPATKKTNITVKEHSTANLEIRNHQIFYKNKQLTNSKSNKRQPMLINGNEIIFLSDQNRGIGFYTLLKISVE